MDAMQQLDQVGGMSGGQSKVMEQWQRREHDHSRNNHKGIVNG